MRKICFRGILFLIILILIFIGYKKVQEINRAIIPSDNMVNISFSYEEFSLSGEVKLKWYETVSYYHAQQIENTVYICISKTMGLGEHHFNFDIRDSIMNSIYKDVERILLVSGEDIIVKYPDKPEENHINVLNYSESILLWER